MNALMMRALHIACYAALACSLATAGDDDDAPGAAAPKSAGQDTAPALNQEQQHAVNLTVAHPLSAKAPARTPALGMILDATSFLADESGRTVADAEEHSASAEADRLRHLYEAGAGASLKMLEAAHAEEAKALADAQLAAARFAQRWGPLAKQSAGERRKLSEDVTAGRSLLVRADLPGQHMVGALPAKALLDVDGVEVPGTVLGVLAQFGELQSAGLLIEVRNPPAGLAAGARVPLSLLGSERTGMLLPREAILYDEHGAYVYKQAAAKTPAGKTRYVPVRVTLLLPYGDGWLVQGVDEDDDIVVRGAGVLWSLEGVGVRAADDEDED